MKKYFITGTSRGIGKAVAENILTKPDVRVSGMSRNCNISHSRYEHVYVDLSKPGDAGEFNFPDLPDAEEIVLINNAGVISNIKRTGQQKTEDIINDYNVNIVSPSILINNFIKKYQYYTNKRVILNVSSGAGRHTTDAWSVYCASKAALDMFSRNIDKEQSFFNEENRIRIYSVAPGVVETEMQRQIRESSEKDFSELKKFVNLKKNGQLTNPEKTAKLLLKIIDDNFSEVILDVRNL
ncbi:MAG: SDR family NAD(P)-dependent oxidoreductase [Chlorobi bacterium]|nr:SDR family NAD(P)-dependent oxidoreductase [Chlorobiota bacterium]